MDKILKYLRSRRLKYGANSVVLVCITLLAIILANLLVENLSLKFDLTPSKLFSLGETTKSILESLDRDVTIYGIFDDGKIGAKNYYIEIIELLDQYEIYPRIKVEYVDPDMNPGFIKKLDPDNRLQISRGDFVFVCGEKIKSIDYYDMLSTYVPLDELYADLEIPATAEQKITGAIKYVSSDNTPVIYFTEGHDENSLFEDYSSFKYYLENNNYDVKTINLLTVERVPDDSELLVIASPQKDISFSEQEKISVYLKNGGKVIMLFDSLETDPDFSRFNELLEYYNISLNYDKVKENDNSRHIPGDPYVILSDVQQNELFSESFNVLLEDSRSINILKSNKKNTKVISLIKTGTHATGEQIDTNRGNNIPGPLDLAVAVEKTGNSQTSKLLVIGNASFISDTAELYNDIYFQNGIYFFLTALNWMLDNSNDTLIIPKTYKAQRIMITEEQAMTLALLFVIVLPIIIFASGLTVYLRRRHL